MAWLSGADQRKLIRIRGQLEEAKAAIDEMHSNYSGKWDDKSEKWQEGETGEAASSINTAIENIGSNIESAVDEFGALELDE